MRRFPSLLLLAIALGAPTAQAEDSGKSGPTSQPSYETVVVGSRGGERAFDSPRAIDVISSRDATERTVTATPQLLDEALGVTLQRTNSAGGAPIIRGLLGQQVLLMVDGIRLNNAITRSGPNQLLNTVDPFQLARIEIFRGAGSVQHGSDALGGVINLVTHKPRFDPWRAWDVGGRAVARFDSAATGLVSHAAASGHLRQFGLRLGGTLRRFDDLLGGRDTGRQPFTSYWEGAADVSAAWIISPAAELRASYAAVRQHDAPRTDRSSPRDFRLFSDQLRDLAALTFDSRLASPWLRRVHASISYQLHRELRERFRLARDVIERERDSVGSIGGLLTLRSDLPYNRVSYGVDVYHDRVASSGEQERISDPIRTPAPRGRYVDDSSYTQLAFFALDRISLLDDKLAFDVGGRVSSWFVEIPADPGNDLAATSTAAVGVVGTAHARYLLGDGINLVAGVSQGFRAPNIDDFSAQGCSGQGYDVPNPDLVPEKSVTAEAGVKFDLFGLLRGSVFYFFTHLDDVIVRRALPDRVAPSCAAGEVLPVTQRQNASGGQIHGVEGRVALTLGHFTLRSWVAWAHGTVEDAGGATEPMGRVPPLNGFAALRYQRQRRWFGEIGVRWSLRQSRLSSADLVDTRICPGGTDGCAGTPGFAVLQIRGGVRLAKPLLITLAVENPTNESYRVHGSGIDGPGASARIGIELQVD